MAKISDYVEKYLELRELKKKLDDEHKAKVEKVSKLLGTLESQFMEHFNQTGSTQVKAGGGTVFVKTTDFAQVRDWDEVLEFIKHNEAYEFLERRVSKTAVSEYVKENNVVPPGVNYGTKMSINVRKAS